MILNYNTNSAPALVDTISSKIVYDKLAGSGQYWHQKQESAATSGGMDDSPLVTSQEDCAACSDHSNDYELHFGNGSTQEVYLSPYDIVCGRDSDSFNHIGNRRFRITISLNLPRYKAAISTQKRGELISSIIKILKNDAGARFLKKKGDKFLELNDREMRQKIGHALRDAAFNDQLKNKRRKNFPSKQAPVQSKITASEVNRKDSLPSSVWSSSEVATLDLPSMSWEEAFLDVL